MMVLMEGGTGIKQGMLKKKRDTELSRKKTLMATKKDS